MVNDVGLLFAQHVGQALGRLVDVGLHEGAGLVVLRPAGHARVAVAQPHHPMAAQHPAMDRSVSSRRRSMSVSPGGEVLGRLAEAAVGGHHEPTRWPWAAARAMVPPVRLASSSGSAWKHTSVAIVPSCWIPGN